jgi:hypothetical protein
MILQKWSVEYHCQKENYSGRNYTCQDSLKNKGDWTYGRFEIKAKLPKGRGTWLLSGCSPLIMLMADGRRVAKSILWNMWVLISTMYIYLMPMHLMD